MFQPQKDSGGMGFNYWVNIIELTKTFWLKARAIALTKTFWLKLKI
jgi:hypothetical protein